MNNLIGAVRVPPEYMSVVYQTLGMETPLSVILKVVILGYEEQYTSPGIHYLIISRKDRRC